MTLIQSHLGLSAIFMRLVIGRCHQKGWLKIIKGYQLEVTMSIHIGTIKYHIKHINMYPLFKVFGGHNVMLTEVEI